MTKVAIVGVSGYAGGELARLLARHPHVTVVAAVSSTYAGKPLKSSFAGLTGTALGNLVCVGGGADAPEVAEADLIFLAQDNGVAMRTAPALLSAGKRVIDLAADYRLRDQVAFQKWYKLEHASPELIADGTAVYGLPEQHREQIRKARLIANPGCHVTATVLGLSPLLQAGLIEPKGIVVDSKSGVSGAGRAKNDLLYKYSEANESVTAYGVGGSHRHIPEIEQSLAEVTGASVAISFTPHLIPMTRGIFSTCYARIGKDGLKSSDLHAALVKAYADEPFVVVREVGDIPKTKDVCGSNYCHIGVSVDERTGMAIVMSVIDNLVKGAAGQAVQNMNLMLGVDETSGLEGAGLWP